MITTTGNKSEMVVGYATLYGDMAGGFDVLKDVPKTLVFRLCEYRNTIGHVIPPRVIDRPPSAVLAPTRRARILPPYPVLDEILRLYIEENVSADAITEQGFDEEIVRKVIRLVDLNEYSKRRQVAVGPRMIGRGFGAFRNPVDSAFSLGSIMFAQLAI
ncbi:NAD+ synthetase [Pseudomonas sp. OV226]|nr:NAD+ synthetase [Pseudomonas sp. OV226]